jgi:hypothetical protein
MKKTDHSERPFHWTEGDVHVGMIVCRRHTAKDYAWEPCGWKAKWTHKIGWVSGDMGEKGDGQYCQIAMTDGMVYHRGLTKEQMAVRLQNEDMIPMSWSRWKKMVEYMKNQTNPI